MQFPININNKKIITNPYFDKFSTDFHNIIEIPIKNHPGSFGFVRKNHIHEGIDIYTLPNEKVYSIDNGIILDIFPFTGEIAGSPWWNNTYAILVKHNNFVVNYGEIIPNQSLKIGSEIKCGDFIGNIKTVLKKNKGRPMDMLHFELYSKDTIKSISSWDLNQIKPENLIDPTNLLLKFVGKT